ncbi:MAG: oxidoreductase [Fervidobacterium sp.]
MKKKDLLKITHETYLITLEGHFEFFPGQFCMVYVDSFGLTRKPLTLGMYKKNIAISVKITGKGTKYIVETKQSLDVLAPCGNRFEPNGKNGVAIVAPSCFAEGYFISKTFNVPLYVTSKTPFDEGFLKVFEGENIEFVVGDENFLKVLKKVSSSYFDWIFVSGSKVMERIAIEILDKRLTYVSLNEYMGCGIGACKSCAIKTESGIKHVCTDGPVFRGNEICL